MKRFPIFRRLSLALLLIAVAHQSNAQSSFKLRYYSPIKPNSTALYSGNISEWESIQATNEASTYTFTYDTQGRLTSSDRYNATATSATYLYTERDISYDRNGNILTLKRISNSIPNPLHNFNYSYDGDKLTSLSGTQSGTQFSSQYAYDGNGNMTLDGNQAIRLSYDINNLVHRAKKTATGQNPSPQQDELTATYSYFADGTKYSIKDTEGNSRIYIGPFTLTRKDYGQSSSGSGSGNISGNNNNSSNTTTPYITLLESADALGSDARFAFTTTPHAASGDTTYTIAYETLYLLKDHLGSIRTITDSQGNILEKNDYYSYGLRTDLGRNYPVLPEKYRMRMPASLAAFSQNGNSYPAISSPAGKMLPYRLLYNGKELQMVAQTRFVDYGARMLDPVIARWNGMDPLSEKNRGQSTFVFCNNNPINCIDIEGKGDFILNGIIIGNDAIDDGKLYVLKTTQKSFGEDDEAVPGAGVSKKELKATIAFIKTNSGRADAFKDSDIAYRNSIEIESSKENRQSMVDIVNKDNGKGGTNASNNREYGGSIEKGRVVEAPPGSVTNPQESKYAFIDLPQGKTTFHSHASGTFSDNSSTNITPQTWSFIQHPSKIDIQEAGNTTNYVFGRGDKMVYIYNSNGVQAVIPQKDFINLKQ